MRADISWKVPDDVNVYGRLHADGSYACAYLTLHTGPAEFELSGIDGRLQLSSMDPAVLRRVAEGLEQLAADLDDYHVGRAAAVASLDVAEARA